MREFYPETRPLFLFEPKNIAYLEGKSHTLFRNWKTQIILGLFFGLFSLIGLVLFFAVLQDAWQRFNLLNYGVKVNATITSKQYEEDSDSLTYWLYYTYPVELKGQPPHNYRGKEGVDAATFSRVEEGSQWQAQYLSESPEVVHLTQTGNNLWVQWLASLLFMLVGSVPSLLLFISYHRSVRREKEGTILKGILTSSQGEMDEGDFKLTLQFNFVNPLGEYLAGKASKTCNHLKEKRLPEAGTGVAILYRNDKDYEVL